MPPPRKPLIGVMGAGESASNADRHLAEDLGGAIARHGWALLSGGRPEGVMGAACAGAMAVEGHLVVGVLPDDGSRRHDPETAAAVDVALFTGLGQGRNVINALSSDVVVVCGAGGPGTAAEAAHALKAGRPLVLLATPPDWLVFFAGLGDGVMACATVAEAMEVIEAQLGAGGWLAAGEGAAGETLVRTTAAAPAPAGSDLPAPGTPAAAAMQGSAAANAAAVNNREDQGHSPPQTLPVALVQLTAGEDPAANRRQAEAWLERALQPASGRAKPRLLMLPEIWNAPYAAARFAAYAEPIPDLIPEGVAPGPDLTEGPSPSLAMVARLARRHGVSVIAGSIPERGADGRLYNTATVIDPQGRLRAKHRKVHLFDVDVPGGIRFRESDSLTGGTGLAVLSGDGDPLATGLAQPPNLGLLICYDIRFPELALLLQQRQGATLLACPAAFTTTTGPRHWHLVMRARALDTQCFLLACSSARPLEEGPYPSYGHSLVVDPWGAVIAEAGIGEQVVHAELDLAEVGRARQAIPTGVQRRGDLYRLGPA
ncbi:MAG: nitrilase-related carbon-nitrogen hydrolase [Cyanobacteriota bacterium]|nr:nitrilase-related carbon-nitrogen hydrolase [Cyanobacteriota bacterium]